MPGGVSAGPALVRSWVTCTAPSLRCFDPSRPRGSLAVSELPGETRPHHVLVQLQRVSGDGRVTTHGPATGRSLSSYTRLCSAPPQGRCPLVLLHCRDTILCSAAAGAPCPSPDQHKSHSCPQGGVLAIHSSHQGLPRKSINDIPRETQDGVRAVARMGPSWPPQAGRLARFPQKAEALVADG